MSDKRPNLETLTAEEFQSRLGQTFRVALPGGEPLETTLAEVHTHKYAPPASNQRKGFSLTFRSALPGHLPQAIYAVTHDEMGTMDLFLVPVGPKDGGMCYEAVFN
jgi:hypothetical protein